MRREPKAILFDLDDTLYPLAQFVRSGFRAVAAHLERTRGVDAARTLRLLTASARSARRGRELQACVERFDLPRSVLPELVDVIRTHHPSLRLPRESRELLQRLRQRWRIGIVTNGVPAIQARKIAALGLGYLVDTVVYATEYGDALGKPAPEPFVEAMERLCVRRRDTVFVGDDERCDLFGASRLGIRTVFSTQWLQAPATRAPRYADAVVASLTQVEAAVDRLLEREWMAYVA